MELAIIIFCVWIISGIISNKLLHGWEFYDLYPTYPILGTPVERWNESTEDRNKFTFDVLIWILGPIGLIPSIIVYGIPAKFKMFKLFRTKI